MLNPSGYTFKLMKALKKLKVRFIPEFSDGHKHIDIRIPSAKLDIEVDGVQHLTDPKQIITDFKRSNYSREDGYETIHVHNMDLKHDAEDIAKAIAEVAEKREDDLSIMAGSPPVSTCCQPESKRIPASLSGTNFFFPSTIIRKRGKSFLQEQVLMGISLG